MTYDLLLERLSQLPPAKRMELVFEHPELAREVFPDIEIPEPKKRGRSSKKSNRQADPPSKGGVDTSADDTSTGSGGTGGFTN